VELWTIRKVLQWTTNDLKKQGVFSARLDAEVLLAHALGTDRLGLFMDLDRPLLPQELVAYRSLIRQRRRRVPVSYLTGTREFWSMSFEVDRHVLIPRPDTEVVVEEALELLPKQGSGLAVDVGTGSGCIALSLAKERGDLRLLALDCDPRAARRATANAVALGLAGQISVAVGDLLEPLSGQVDLVVANLPYIPTAQLETLEPEVSTWEPRLALDGGGDGLDLIRRLLPQAAGLVRRGGGIALEIGDGDQARLVERLLARDWERVAIRRDYGGSPRAVVARRR
jgi:release factor glutamine methyltransferase